MVWFEYRIKCDCGKWETKETESGASDRNLGSFDCSHFTINVYQATKVAWFFGTNGWVRFDFRVKCLKCDYKFDEFSYEGTSDNSMAIQQSKMFHCCGNQILVQGRDGCTDWLTSHKHYYGPTRNLTLNFLSCETKIFSSQMNIYKFS